MSRSIHRWLVNCALLGALSASPAAFGAEPTQSDAPKQPARLRMFRAEQIKTAPLHDARGSTVGNLRDLVIDRRTGNVTHLVVDRPDGKHVTLPWGAQRIGADGAIVVTEPARARPFDPAAPPHHSFNSSPSGAIASLRAAEGNINLGTLSELKSLPVRNIIGQKLGAITDVMISEDSRVQQVICRHGGLAGLGVKTMPMPWEAIAWVPRAGRVVFNVDIRSRDSLSMDRTELAELQQRGAEPLQPAPVLVHFREVFGDIAPARDPQEELLLSKLSVTDRALLTSPLGAGDLNFFRRGLRQPDQETIVVRKAANGSYSRWPIGDFVKRFPQPESR